MSKQSFRECAKAHPNFMTPRIRSVLQVGDDRFIEVSEGTGFHDEPIFGVTIAKKAKSGFSTGDPRSRMFFNKAEALAYARKLRKVI